MRRFVNMNKKIQISHAHMFSPRTPRTEGRRPKGTPLLGRALPITWACKICIILSHGQSRMSTDDTRRIIFSHGQSRMYTDNARMIILSHGQSRMYTEF